MTSRRVFLKQASVSAAALVVGCADDGDASADSDAGAGHDAGDDLDPDAGFAADAGQPHDAGVAQDAGAPEAVVPPESTSLSTLFPLGVSSGDADADRIVLWSRYDGLAPLVVVVWRMEQGAYAAVHAVADAVVADGGFVHKDVVGLVAGARYRYAFFEMSGEMSGAERIARSIVGAFRAPLAADALTPVVLGATACSKHSMPFDALARAAEMPDLDAFLLLGDNAYCDGCRTRDEYRDLWQQHWEKPEHKALRASVQTYATWDDHEVANDWTPETIDPERLADARGAFFEHLPLARLAEPDRIWRSRRIGLTVEIFVLDCRGERQPSTIASDDEIYISRAQMDWLKQGLADSPCAFKVIMNSVPITRFPTLWNAWQVDRWDAYDAQRTEILSFIDDGAIGGVLWVAGDFHLAKTGRVSPDGAGANQIEVLVGPAAQNENSLTFSVQPNALGAQHFDWASGENNVTRLELDPATMTARIVFVNGAGEVIREDVYTL